MSKGGIKIDTNQQLEYLLNYLIDERQENIEIPEDIIQKKNLLRSLMNVRPPIPISEEFLDVQDEYLTNEILSKDLVGVEDIGEFKGKKLNKNDEEILKTSEKLLNQEFGFVLNINPDEIPSYIEHCIA